MDAIPPDSIAAAGLPIDPAKWANDALDRGYEILISTYGRLYRISTKSREAWRKVGHEVLKMDSTGMLLMIEGQSRGKPRYVALPDNGFGMRATKPGTILVR